MKEKTKQLFICTLCSLLSILSTGRYACADVIVESEYYGNDPLSQLAQAAINLIVLGAAVMGIIAILLIRRHRKEEERMEQERREAEKEEI